MAKIELLVKRGSDWQEPVVEGEITLESERRGSPAVLKFNVLKNGLSDFNEGAEVRFIVDGVKMFYGFVFNKSRDKEQIISVTAYDQLRYFKNSDTCIYKNKTAGALLKMLCNDFNLKWAHVEDTKFSIGSRIEDNCTLFDIIENALTLTLQNTKELYVLYDDFGGICLKNIKNMKLDLLIDSETGENYSYTTSIDTQTYNKIKLVYEYDEETSTTTGTGKTTKKKTGNKVRENYIAKDSDSINRWGVLQYYATIQKDENGEVKANNLLDLYNRKSRNLSINGCFGDKRLRAGNTIAIKLSLGDIEVANWMICESVRHVFSNDSHTMDLKLIGNDFI